MATKEKTVQAKASKPKAAKAKPKAAKQKAAKQQEQFPARKAVEVILVDEDRPLHYREAAELALGRGLVKVRKGATPEATAKTFRSYLAGCTAEGVKFTRVEPGVFKPKNKAQAAARVRKYREASEAS